MNSLDALVNHLLTYFFYILLCKRRIGVYMAIAVIPFTANDTQHAEKTPLGTFFLLSQTDVCNQELTTARSIASL